MDRTVNLGEGSKLKNQNLSPATPLATSNGSSTPRPAPSTPASTPLLRRALEHHHAGRLLEAEQNYREILRQNPNHADALHLLGMVLHAKLLHANAEALIRKAISIQPNQSVYQSNLGIVLGAMGKTRAAIVAYQTAANLNPQSAAVHNNLGVALHGSGELQRALDCFKRAVVLQPDYRDAQVNLLAMLKLHPDSAAANHALGDLLHEAEQSNSAIGFYRRAIELNPQSAETYNNLGNALFATGEAADALLCYQQAMSLSPDFPQACNNLANALKEFDRLDEAISAYQRAVELQPKSADPLSNLGNALREDGQWDRAMECYQRALALQPEHAITYNNIGNAYCEIGDWSRAIRAYERALELNPDYADAINNIGTALEETGQRDRAMVCYQRAMALSPQAVSPPWNIALLQLLTGDYENGWPGYEHRWRQKKQCKTWRLFPQPMITNLTEVKNKRVLLHAEQGFGDAIQFCRYASLVAAHGAIVLMECPAKLVRLFSSLSSVTQVIERGDELPPFDLHCPLMSLPMLFKTRVKTVLDPVFYLSPAVADVRRWQARFTSQDKSLRVGLVWAGHGGHQKDRHRSLTLSSLAPLSIASSATFYSLQVGPAALEAASAPPGMQLIDWTAELEDFADTAALISQLDLVITVDTAVCHLAGAMGKPVWILLAYQPDWRWLLDRDDSPWYGSARLFRQTTPGDWEQPLWRIAAELTRLASNHAGL